MKRCRARTSASGMSNFAMPASRSKTAACSTRSIPSRHGRAAPACGRVDLYSRWLDRSGSGNVRPIGRGQEESGRSLPITSATHPEAAWYDELATLHAAASYAVQSEDRHVARAVANGSSFVQREIEPDHATAQPWALFAFIWNEQTRPLADQLLHAVELRRESKLDGISLILLEDALYCLRLFL